MHWSWQDLEDTPDYVRQYVWDLMQARVAAEHNVQDREARHA